jgi:hypothetical protein
MGDNLSYVEIVVIFLLLWELWLVFGAIRSFRNKFKGLALEADTWRTEYNKMKIECIKAQLRVNELLKEKEAVKMTFKDSPSLDPKYLRKKPKIKKAG